VNTSTVTFDTMGTTVSLRFGGGAALGMSLDAVTASVQSVFHRLDERFSLYRPDSELSRIAARELSLMDASAELREVYASALGWRGETGGAFTPHRPDGVVDLSGIVKAWAMNEAAAILDGSADTWMLAVGGDVLVAEARSEAAPAPLIGIVDPFDRGALLTSVLLPPGRRAVATSGLAERGEHIWGDAPFAQVTVVADDIVTADVLATAILAGGTGILDQATSTWSIDVLTVARDGAMLATPGIRSSIARAAESA
jgi:thiamine biosynthesis lipoprotein